MQKPTLVILAAGMGSRYGGPKQIDPVGPNGELIIDYSIYDAKQAGFSRVVFLIREDMKEAFDEAIGDRVRRQMEVTYAFQEPDAFLPAGFMRDPARTKPLGTSHAILCCKNAVDGPFAVINADDYYGPHGFRSMYDFLAGCDATALDFAMVGYELDHTMSENGKVARGVCETAGGMLTGIIERTWVQWLDGKAVFSLDDGASFLPIDPKSPVSMNFWGFTPALFAELERRFADFLKNDYPEDPMKSEMLIPNTVGAMIVEGVSSVRVITSGDRWMGVTYKTDKPEVEREISEKIARGEYPTPIWG